MTSISSRDVGSVDRSLAADQIGRILDSPPDLAPEILRGDTRLTRRWRHGAFRSALPPMRGHVIMTYYAHPHDIHWQSGRHRLSARTQPGTVTLIPEGHDGRWEVAGGIEVSHVYLTSQRLQSCADALANGTGIELLDRVGFDDPVAARILELLAREAAMGETSSRLFVEQAIDLLSTQLIRGHSTSGKVESPSLRRGLAEWQVRRVTQYMRENLGDDIGLDELAGVAGLSRFHFCTSFRLATGKTPHEWLTGERIERARDLLRDPILSVTEVALTVGYSTPSAFAAAFRKLTTMTPTEYRREFGAPVLSS